MRLMKWITNLKLIDISFPYKEGMGIYPDNPQYEISKIKSIETGDNCNVVKISLGSHTGTHVDSPSHVIPNGKSIDEITLETMNGKARVVDMMGKPEIGLEELRNKKILQGEIVLFKTDNTVHYRGDNVLQEYVTLTYDAAKYLADTEVKLVGIDYMTIERPRKTRESDKSVHKTLLEKGVLVLESLNLIEVYEGNYRLHCYPLNIIGSDGSPVRAVLETIDEYTY